MLKFYSGFLVVIGLITIVASIIAAFGLIVMLVHDAGAAGTDVQGGAVLMALGGGFGGAAIGAIGELLQVVVQIEENTRPIVFKPEMRAEQ